MPDKHTNVLAVETAVHISNVSLNSRSAGEIRCFVVCVCCGPSPCVIHGKPCFHSIEMAERQNWAVCCISAVPEKQSRTAQSVSAAKAAQSGFKFGGEMELKNLALNCSGQLVGERKPPGKLDLRIFFCFLILYALPPNLSPLELSEGCV